MKKLNLIFAAITIVLCSCQKSNDSKDDGIHAGGLYSPLTESVISPYNTQFIVGDSIYNCNKIEATLYSHQPSSNQNNFYISLTDTNQAVFNWINLEVYTPVMPPETFFKKGTFTIDTLNITHCLTNSSFSEFVYGVDATFTWDTVYYENLRFKGQGSLEFSKIIESISYPGVFYPAQKVQFQFK